MNLFEQRLAQPLGKAADELAGDGCMINDRASVIDANRAIEGDGTGVGVDIQHHLVGAIAPGLALVFIADIGVKRGVLAAFALGFDLVTGVMDSAAADGGGPAGNGAYSSEGGGGIAEGDADLTKKYTKNI